MTRGLPKGPVTARAWVSERLSPPVLDLGLQFTLASGGTGSRSVERLQPNERGSPMEPPFLEIEIGQPDDYWPPPGTGDHVDVRAWFKDVRGIAEYESSLSADLRQQSDFVAGIQRGSGYVSRSPSR